MYSVPKYEYHVELLPFDDMDSYKDHLNYLGEMGWQLIQTDAVEGSVLDEPDQPMNIVCGTFSRVLIELEICAN